MCYYITGTLPRSADLHAVRAVEGPEGSAWRPLTNPGIQRQLPRDSRYYLITGSYCDCHSAFVAHHYAAPRKRRSLPRQAARWSASKQQRWREQRDAVDAAHTAAADLRLSAWVRYLRQLAEVAAPGAIGLIAHFYNGAIDSEHFDIAVEKPVSGIDLSVDMLRTWQADHLHLITASPAERHAIRRSKQ